MRVAVKYVGPLSSYSGYGEANRTFVAALHSVGVDITTQIIHYDNNRTNYFGKEYELVQGLENSAINYDIKIIHVPGDSYLKHLEPCRFHIGHLFWETDSMSPEWVWNCNLMDEIWTGSEHNKKAFEKSGVRVPIWVFPETMDMELNLDKYKKWEIPNHEGYLFYSIFQWIERKNPQALVKAYLEEFNQDEGVGLLIKTYKDKFTHKEKSEIMAQIDAWKGEVGKPRDKQPPIYVNVELMDKVDVFRIHKTGDCFVLPHRGEGWCVLPKTKIHTNKGLVNIEKCEGEKVLTHNGRYKKAKLLTREHKGKMIKINPYYTEPISLTPEHKVLVIRRKTSDKFNKIKDEKATWVEARDISKGDLVCFPRAKETHDKKAIKISEYIIKSGLSKRKGYVFPSTGGNKKYPAHRIKDKIEISKQFLYLCGLFLAEGSTRRGRCVVFSLNKNEEEIINKIEVIAKNLFGINITKEIMERNRINIVIGSVILGKLFRKLFNTGAKNKSLPDWMMELPTAKIQFILEGLWDGDGSVYKETAVKVGSYSTISEKLAWQVWLMLTRVCPDPISIGCKKRKIYNNEWQVKVKGNNNCKELGYIFPNYNETRVNRKNGRGDKDYLYFVVKEVSEFNYDGRVYNLAVKDDETYTTSSFVIHNCRPIMESLMFNNPIIATNAGGIHDWLTKESYYPLSYEEIKVFGMEFAPWYRTNQKWADINIPELQDKMRKVYNNREDSTEVGKRGGEFGRQNFSYEAAGRMMKDRLIDIQKMIEKEKSQGKRWLIF